jgi:hypothetical protein
MRQLEDDAITATTTASSPFCRAIEVSPFVYGQAGLGSLPHPVRR